MSLHSSSAAGPNRDGSLGPALCLIPQIESDLKSYFSDLSTTPLVGATTHHFLVGLQKQPPGRSPCLTSPPAGSSQQSRQWDPVKPSQTAPLLCSKPYNHLHLTRETSTFFHSLEVPVTDPWSFSDLSYPHLSLSLLFTC